MKQRIMLILLISINVLIVAWIARAESAAPSWDAIEPAGDGYRIHQRQKGGLNSCYEYTINYR